MKWTRDPSRPIQISPGKNMLCRFFWGAFHQHKFLVTAILYLPQWSSVVPFARYSACEIAWHRWNC